MTRFPNAVEIYLRLGGATRGLKHRSTSALARQCMREFFGIFRKQWIGQDRHAKSMAAGILC